MNRLEKYEHVFDDIQPWAGIVPKGYIAEFFGVLIDAQFREILGVKASEQGGGFVETKRPSIATHDEGWFEIVNWVLAAREAKNRFTMMTLGACYGFQAVGAYKALQAVNPMPARLVAVEAEPGNYLWISKHFLDNGIEPGDHWLLQAAVSESNEPALFPVGSSGTGAQNFMSTNPLPERARVVDEIVRKGQAEQAVRSILLENRTGVVRDLVPGHDYMAELRFVSSITLKQLLAPLDFVDYLEVDIQGAEIIILPPALDALRRKVRFIHVGTHGDDVHQRLHQIFEQDGWEIIFSYGCMQTHQTPMGPFRANDGILTMRNRRL